MKLANALLLARFVVCLPSRVKLPFDAFSLSFLRRDEHPCDADASRSTVNPIVCLEPFYSCVVTVFFLASDLCQQRSTASMSGWRSLRGGCPCLLQ